MDRKWEIGDIVIDEDNCAGIVCIRNADGDIVTFQNDAAHPNPVKANEKEVQRIRKLLESWGKPVK